MNICHNDWFNKKDDCLIAKQNKPRQKKRNQSENDGIKKGQSQRSCQLDTQKTGHAQNLITSHEPCDNTQMNRNGLI